MGNWKLVVVGVVVLAVPLALAAFSAIPSLRAAPKRAWQRAPLPQPPREGSLAFEIRDADSDALIPGKLTLVGVGNSRDPRLGGGGDSSDIGREEGGALSAFNRVFSITGTGVVRVPEGRYDVYVSRGPEWELDVTRQLKIAAGGVAEVRARLRHTVDTSGWLSADFHVHAARSSDSRVPMRDRVYEFAGDGVDLIVATDHNAMADYAPFIGELGAAPYLTSAVGDELTTASWGHFGAFPLPPSFETTGRGPAPAGDLATEIFADVRRRAPAAVIDVHHPRLDAEIGYFNLGRLESGSDVAARPGFSFDFDAVEVLNGYQDPDRKSVERTLADWFALLDHGHLVTATGNSDTHHLSYNLGGYPRNYVRVSDDHPQRASIDEVARNVKARRALFTTGPFIKFSAAAGAGGATPAAQIGDVLSSRGGAVTVQLEVWAPTWMKVSKVSLLQNGSEVQRWDLTERGQALRLRASHSLTAPRDSHLVVRVDGDAPMAPVVGDRQRFTVYPFAVTNPIFVDVDGNGRFDAPLPHGAHNRAQKNPR